MSVADRLGRLLYIVPYVVHRDGVPLQELADKLGVKPRQIEADLDLLAMVGHPPLTPDHLIDLYVEDDIVYVELDQNLSRPLRLTHDEARAIVLAAKLVGDLGGVGEQLDQIVERLLTLLGPADAEMVRSLSERIALGREEEDSVAVRLRGAVEARQEVEVDYYSASSDRQKRYRLQPLALISHSGVDYLLALDVAAQGHEKLFRTDRIGELVVLDTVFEPPQELDLEKYRRQTLYVGSDQTWAEVEFSANVARLVRERFADQRVEPGEDGGVRVKLSTSSTAWLARWVLPFGTDAEVLGPPEQREAVGKLCAEAAAVYGKR